MKYMRDDLKDTYGFLALQDKILEIMVEIDKICSANNIEYFVMGGTAIGAIRHQGFIPWDDDLDIFMTTENYKKFVNVFPKNSNLYLQEWCKVGDMIRMAKVRDSNTTLIENAVSDWNINHGVYVDIFILHKAAPTHFGVKRQEFWSKLLVTKGLSKKDYKTKNLFKKFMLCAIHIMPTNFVKKHSLKIIYKYDSKSNFKFYFHFVGRASIKRGLYSKEIFQSSKYIKFEKVQLLAPILLESYLMKRWGENYMTPPNQKQIKAMQHPSKWNVNESFLTYSSQFDPNKTEDKLI